MRVIVQRAANACVRIDGEVVGHIDKGFMLLVGITHTDTQDDADYIAKKVAQRLTSVGSLFLYQEQLCPIPTNQLTIG